MPVRAGANVFPGDYRTPNRVVFTPGETEKTFTVEALEDGEAEPEESLVVQLGDEAEPQDRARIVSPRPSATVRIVASTEDAPIRVGLESINYSYHEEVGEAVIAIVAQRDGTPIADRGTIVVDYEFSDTTAVSPADYTARNGSAVIAPGESRVEITIPLNNDTLPETIERFQIVLTNVSSSRPGATFDFAPTSGQVTITDTDSSGIFLKEAKENPPDGILEVFESDESVSVTQALASEVGYPFTTIAQTLQGGGTEAGSANDYIHFSNTVFFAPLDLEEEFEIMLVDDATPELVEDFYVSLLRNGISESIEITHSLLTIRIKDDDPAFRVSPETRTLEEPAGAGTRAMREVAIGIQSPMPQTVSVEWETDDGADPTPGQNRVARTGQDFAYASGTAVFRPGETEKRIQVPILGDGVVEWAKTMHVTLKNPSAGGVVADDSPLADASAQEDFPVTIADGDGPLPIALVVPETLGEGESFTVTPRMGKAHDLAVTTSVRLSPLSGQATPGSDVTATPDPLETDFASGTLTVPGSEATITAIDDNESEGAETFEVHLQVLAAPGGEYPPVEMRDRRWRVTIIDDDAASTPGVTSIQGDGSRAIRQVVKVPEGGTNQIRITLDTPPSETVTIGFRERYRDRDITVTGARSRAFDAANWSTPWVIDLSADEDADAIDGETLLRLSFETDSPEYEARSHIDRRVIIVREDDDDTDPGGAVSHVGDLPGSPSGVMIVDHAMPARHDGRSPFYVEVEFSRGIDAPAARMRDHAWKTDDMKVLRAERVDGSARRWRFRMRPFNREQVLLSLNANTPCGTSTSICSNESPAKPVVNTLRIAIPGPGHQPGVLPPGVAGDPVFDIEGERVNESAGSLDFTVTLSKALFTEASVYFATADRTARAGEDYESRSERLVFAPGDQTKTVTITIVSDATDEGVEVFRGVIGVPAGGRIRTGEALGEIANTGPMPKAWISRFGRTAAVQVAEAIEARLGAGAGPRRDIAIAGVAATGEERGDEAWERPGEAGGEAHGATLTAAELLARSSFHLAGGSERAGAPRWAFWGRVAESGFSGRESGLDIDGRVTSLVAGADTGRGAWTAGFALAHADGDGGLGSDIDVAGATLTSVHPYVGFEPSEATRLWGVVGHGEGRLRYVERVDGKAVAYGTDLEGSMAAFGARRRLHRAGEAVGLEIASEADVLLTRTRSAAASGIMGASARTSRVRALIEAEAQGGPFVTSFDLGLRYDGGDADKGFGLEAGAAVRYVAPGRPVVFQAAARTVLAHEAKDAREWAVSAAAAWNEGGTGFQLSLAPAWGDADGGPSLWEALPCEGECGREAAVRLRSSIGYGLRSPRFPGLVRPFADLAWRAESSRTARLGVGWDLTGGARVEAMVEQADEGRFMVRARVSW